MGLPARLRTLPVLALVAANALPLVGVLLLGWRLADVLLLYWAESAVIGAMTVVRLVRSAGAMALVAVPFFCLHFGIFMGVHLMFLASLFDVGSGASLRELALPLLGLAAGHAVPLAQDLRRAPAEREDPKKVFLAPYPRVVVMHLTILLGGFLVLLLGQPAAALLFLVALKTGIDLAAHLRERRKRDEASTTRTQPA